MRKEHDTEATSQDMSPVVKAWMEMDLNDPQHTIKLVTKWLKDADVAIIKTDLERCYISTLLLLLYLSPSENLWAENQRCVRARRLTNLNQLHQSCHVEWAKIKANYCEQTIVNTQNVCPLHPAQRQWYQMLRKCTKTFNIEENNKNHLKKLHHSGIQQRNNFCISK